MGFFNKNKNRKKQTQKDEKTPLWVKEIKRHPVNDSRAEQYDFEFIDNSENIDTNSKIEQLGTKNVLCCEIAKINTQQIKILKNCKTENTLLELMKILKRSNRTRFRNDILTPLIICNFFEQTVPQKPKSPKQKYRLTTKFVKRLI